jgi:hypothetical protein
LPCFGFDNSRRACTKFEAKRWCLYLSFDFGALPECHSAQRYHGYSAREEEG